MLKIQNKDSNYLAKIDVIKDIRLHNNADKLQVVTIDGNNIITDLSAKIGDRIVYCPIESQLSDLFLKNNNLYEEKTLNSAIEEKGYFNKQGRVRCISLRGERSEGMMFPLSALENTYNVDLTNIKNGEYFDTINGELFIKKYTSIQARNNGTGITKEKNNIVDIIVDGQFRFHTSTPQLAANIYNLNRDNYIYITQKLHGTSAIFSNILCKKKLKWYQNFLKFFGVKYVESEYKRIYSSRTVIKNDKINGRYYGEDIWQIVNSKIQNIPEGISIYGEIVGFLPSGKQIQNNYNYGCNLREHKFYVYRVTFTDEKGNVKEYNWKELEKFCKDNDLLSVPLLWEGTCDKIYKSKVTKNWHDNLLKRLKDKYLEKDIDGVNGKIPDEGIIIANYTDNKKKSYKLKSFKFNSMETKQLDKGEVNIEEEN